MDVDPKITLKLAETKSLLWIEAQATITQRASQNRPVKVTTYVLYRAYGILQTVHGKPMKTSQTMVV